MHPAGDHISIELIHEHSDIVTDAPPVLKAIVKEVSPDIEVPFNKHDLIWVSNGRVISLRGELFVNKQFCTMYSEK